MQPGQNDARENQDTERLAVEEGRAQQGDSEPSGPRGTAEVSGLAGVQDCWVQAEPGRGRLNQEYADWIYLSNAIPQPRALSAQYHK